MFDQFVDSLKEKIDDISNSVDEKLKEAREQNKQDADKADLFSSLVGFVDETGDSISKLFEDEEVDGKKKKRSPHHHHNHKAGSADSRRASSNKKQGKVAASASSSKTALDDEDDMYGYNISSDSEEEDEVRDMPLMRFNKKLNPSNGQKAPDLSDMGGQPLPRYALPSSYLNAGEVCKRRITTTKRITEADLDKDSPLYRHRAQVTDVPRLQPCDETNPVVDPANVSTHFLLFTTFSRFMIPVGRKVDSDHNLLNSFIGQYMHYSIYTSIYIGLKLQSLKFKELQYV